MWPRLLESSILAVAPTDLTTAVLVSSVAGIPVEASALASGESALSCAGPAAGPAAEPAAAGVMGLYGGPDVGAGAALAVVGCSSPPAGQSVVVR